MVRPVACPVFLSRVFPTQFPMPYQTISRRQGRSRGPVMSRLMMDTDCTGINRPCYISWSHPLMGITNSTAELDILAQIYLDNVFVVFSSILAILAFKNLINLDEMIQQLLMFCPLRLFLNLFKKEY